MTAPATRSASPPPPRRDSPGPLDLTGAQLGRLVVLARLEPGSWLVECECGRRTRARTDNLTAGRTRSCGDPAHRLRDRVQYGGAHNRVTTALGPARLRRCADCGRGAAQWAYDHTDPAEQAAGARRYSLDPAHYTARCVSCHVLFDLAYLATGTPPAPTRWVVVQPALLPDEQLDRLGPPTGPHPPATADPTETGAGMTTTDRDAPDEFDPIRARGTHGYPRPDTRGMVPLAGGALVTPDMARELLTRMRARRPDPPAPGTDPNMTVA